jgi:hypothetical protein
MTASRDFDPRKVLERVRALLERAGHPDTPPEEARTSAVLAARMIREYKLEVSHQPSAASRQESYSSPATRRTSRAGGWRPEAGGSPPRRRRKWSSPACTCFDGVLDIDCPEHGRASHEVDAPPLEVFEKCIRATGNGSCTKCGAPYVVGEVVIMTHNLWYQHARCWRPSTVVG